MDYNAKSKLTGQINYLLGKANKSNIKVHELSHDDIRSQLRGGSQGFDEPDGRRLDLDSRYLRNLFHL